MPSFDIVSEIEMSEVRNAVENASRELSTRFDFRGVEASIEFKDESVLLIAEGEFQLQQLTDMLRNACSKRNLDAGSMDPQAVVRSGKTHRCTVKFKQGIEQPMAKKIVKLIKDSKIKVQASIQGEQVRVTGKKRDELQATMALVKNGELGQPFQFTNFRD